MADWATVSALPSLSDIRLAVRTERRAREWSLDKLSEVSGVDRAAIHKIENTKTYPTYEPGIDTFKKIIEAMGLTLSEFFGRIEGLSPTGQTDQQSHSPISPEAEANHGRDLSAAERADLIVQRTFIAALAEEIVGAVDRLVEARTANQPTRSNHAGGARKNSRSSTR
jgi:transcriptional regulator with XRE-family HTH domain